MKYKDMIYPANIPWLKMNLQLIYIRGNIRATNFSSQNCLRHSKKSGRQRPDPGHFKCPTGHQALPCAGDFDADSGHIKSRLHMLKELHNSWNQMSIYHLGSN